MMHTEETIEFLLEDIISFHEVLGENFSMKSGIHDMNLLESAVSAPFQTFGGHDLYPTIFAKAAHLCYGLTKNHPFTDGNKRTALHTMIVYLEVNDIYLQYDDTEIENIIIAIADGSMSPDELAYWLELSALS